MIRSKVDISEMSDYQIRRMLLAERKRRMHIRVASRLGILILVVLMVLYLVSATINFLLVKDTHAADEQEEKAPVRGTIFVDAGHGGEDPGADGLHDRLEKDDTLEMAKAVKVALEESNFKVVMSREADETVERARRGEMANECDAAFMISIHRNKAFEGQGMEMYIPSTDDPDSRQLAENIMAGLEKVGITQNRGIKAGTLFDPYDDYQENSVSIMPSVLIEFGFVSDSQDNDLFDTKMDKYAEAVAKGVSKSYKAIYEDGQ